jgi:hypothetical protein
MPRSATIGVFRHTRSNDRKACYCVRCDGVEVGDLWEGQTKYFSVKPGSHTVWVKSSFLSSNKLDVVLGEGQTVELACRTMGHSKR